MAFPNWQAERPMFWKMDRGTGSPGQPHQGTINSFPDQLAHLSKLSATKINDKKNCAPWRLLDRSGFWRSAFADWPGPAVPVRSEKLLTERSTTYSGGKSSAAIKASSGKWLHEVFLYAQMYGCTLGTLPNNDSKAETAGGTPPNKRNGPVPSGLQFDPLSSR